MGEKGFDAGIELDPKKIQGLIRNQALFRRSGQ